MKTKKGISLVTLAITIIVTVIFAGIIIASTDNVLTEAERDNFVIELSTIEDKVKEYHLLMGVLPVKLGTTYTANEIKAKLAVSSQQALLANEITVNNDTNNTFMVIDIDLLGIQTDERGTTQQDTDVFIVASNTLNVYYLKGFEYEDVVRFSQVTLVSQNDIETDTEYVDSEVELDTQLSLVKNINVWTNEISITIKNNLQENETLQYSVSGAVEKAVPNNNIIILNSANLTDTEKAALATNKLVTVNRLVNDSVTETKTIAIDNLDLTSPVLGTMEMTNTSSEQYNLVKLNSSDEGGSEIKCLYYDYATMLVNSIETSYYTNRSDVSANELMSFGKITNDGTIKLDKNIKSIVAVAVDNAGNASSITTYTLEDTYLKSE